MSDERCHRCDRVECVGSLIRTAMFTADQMRDCQATAIDWRARAKTAESALAANQADLREWTRRAQEAEAKAVTGRIALYEDEATKLREDIADLERKHAGLREFVDSGVVEGEACLMAANDARKETVEAIARWLLDIRFTKANREAEWTRHIAAQISAGAWRSK